LTARLQLAGYFIASVIHSELGVDFLKFVWTVPEKEVEEPLLTTS
jgi:hypothetical protein